MTDQEKQAKKCCICDGLIGEQHSHNAYPVMTGRCCGVCNDAIVIPARLRDAGIVLGEAASVRGSGNFGSGYPTNYFPE
jgi:hypothetical protein